MWRRPTVLISLAVFASAVVYLLGNDRVGLFDRDEPRYAQTSRQMLESNPPDRVVPRLLDDVRTAKPVFIYWAQAASMALLGVGEFAARLPSALAMLAVLVLAGVFVARIAGLRRAAWTVFILGSSALAVAAAKMCITDAVLLLWIAIAEGCLYAMYRGSRGLAVAVVLWLAVGLAGLTKGPVVVGVLLSTMLVLAMLDVASGWRSGDAWKRAVQWWRHTRPLLGLAILAAVVGPWLAAVHMRDPSFLKQSLWHDVFTRSVRPLEGHKGPPGFYLLTIWGTFTPWSLFLPTAIALSWKHRRLPPLRFALAATAGPWVVWEFIQTKLVHYMLPVFPALAFMTADALVRCIRRQHNDMHTPLARAAALAWALAVAIAGQLPWLAGRFFSPLPPSLHFAAAGISLAALALGASVWWMMRAGRPAAAAICMGAGWMLVVALFYGAWLPQAEFLWLPRQIGAFLVAEGATRKGDIFMLDYDPDSLAFYQGGTIRRARPDLLKTGDRNIPGRWLVMTESLWNNLAPEIKDRLEIRRSWRGWDYASRGRIVTVVVVRRR